jgi:dTDP-4-amino-4,6-dideoxygalactose transaminase
VTVRDSFLPFSPPALGDDEVERVTEVLRSSWITTGPRVREFETRFAEYLGAPSALAVSSCTDAMQVALAALGIGPGDAVVTTTMTFCATAHVAEHLGATPVLVDVRPDDLNIDVHAIEAALGGARRAGLRPRALMPVHFAGQPCDMPAILDLAEQHGLAVVEDAAHALPASVGGQRIGVTEPSRVPRAVAFSFYATKNLTTAEGGMLLATPELLEEARLWSLHGMSRDAWKRYDAGGSWFYEVVRPGFKCNMTDIAAALGLAQLERLEGFQQRRREIVGRYDEAFGSCEALQMPARHPGDEHAWHLYVLRLELDRLRIGRNEFIAELAARNIGTSVHFIPLHLHPFYRDRYQLAPEQFPVAGREYERLVSLPLHPGLTDQDVADVIEAVLDVIATNRR